MPDERVDGADRELSEEDYAMMAVEEDPDTERFLA